MRVRLESVGCRLNIGEMDAIGRQLLEQGHRLVGADEAADLCVFNTCTVTAIASRKSRQLIRQLRRANPSTVIVATGCYAEMAPEEVRALDVDHVIGNRDKDRMVEVLKERGVIDPAAKPEPDGTGTVLEPGTGGRTRAFVKVQDGCDNRCAFCVVTIARGAGRSRPAAEVIAEIEALRAAGYQEVVLSGVHLGSYGHDSGDRRGLERLVVSVLADTDLPRLRLSSLEPWDLEATLFELFADERFQPHLHLPLQSGCDATLRRMARHTDQRAFAAIVEHARASIADVSISTDVMVGFPGETEEEFETSIAYVERLAFSRLHVFRFSPREGTPAATMPEHVPARVAQERSQRMLALGERLADGFHRRVVGRTTSVLWEESSTTPSGRRWSGLTGNYIRVHAETAPTVDLANQVTPAEIVRVVPGGVEGRVR